MVDRSRCQHDGACVESCPVQVLELGPDRTPVDIPARVARCLGCGHCLAVCPTGALALASLPRSTLLPIQTDLGASPEEVEQLLRSRRSIRAYQERPVPRELIERALDATRQAPSGHNRQPVGWTVVSGPDSVHALASAVITWMRGLVAQAHLLGEALGAEDLVERWERGEDPILRRAPHVVLAHANAANPTASVAATIAITYLQLVASALGLGTCWAGYLQIAVGQQPAVARLVEVPEGHRIHGATMLGYPRYRYSAIPARKALDVRWQ
jgi:nitroreductase/NAD-dependent dihydropyrimidine dehydrogenase PreA subunit